MGGRFNEDEQRRNMEGHLTDLWKGRGGWL